MAKGEIDIRSKQPSGSQPFTWHLIHLLHHGMFGEVAIACSVSSSVEESAKESVMVMLALVVRPAHLAGRRDRHGALHPGHLQAPHIGHRVALVVVVVVIPVLVANPDVESLAHLVVEGLAPLVLYPVRFMIHFVVHPVFGVAPLMGVAVRVMVAGKTLQDGAESGECKYNHGI